ncbi:RDD family protein [Streptomyces sp. AA1529]|uniref:RDD family protein n=1 Tax=Streptomyces sp. AA1529 TaxID=1203257 RepID=UPI003D72F4C4
MPRAGYYPDPSIPGYIRYWNGSSWVPGTSRPEPREGEPMPAPPPVASSPAAAPAPPATGGQEGPAGPPSPRRSTADETGPVFLDEGGDGGGPGPQRPAPGPEPAASGASPGPAPARPQSGPGQSGPGQSGPGQSGPPQGGFGPPAADPRGDWGADARAAERTEREPGPAPEAPQPGGREKTVGLRRSEVLRTGDRTPQAGAPARPAPDAAGSGGPSAESGAPGAVPVPDPAPNRPVPTAVNPPEQSAPAAASAPPGGAAAIPAQSPAQSRAPENGRPSPGGYAPDRGESDPSGTGGTPAPVPGRTSGPGRPAPAQGAAGAVAERPGQQTALGAGPVALPAQQGPAAGLAPVPGPGQDPAGLPPAQQSGGLPEPTAPSWSQPTGAPAQPQSAGQDAVTPWRPPADDPFARVAQQEARPGALGMRLGARLVDLVLTLGVAAGAAFPFVDRTIDHIDAKVEAVERAGVTQRVWLVDGTTGGYLALVLGVVLVFGLVYEVLPTARWGRTLGKKLFGLSVVNIEGYGRPSFGKAVLRWLVHGVLGLLVVGVVNAAWCLFDRPWRQCWHDKAAGTFVAKGRAGGGELRL